MFHKLTRVFIYITFYSCRSNVFGDKFWVTIAINYAYWLYVLRKELVFTFNKADKNGNTFIAPKISVKKKKKKDKKGHITVVSVHIFCRCKLRLGS